MVREIFGRLLPYGQVPQTLLIGGFSGVILEGTLFLLAPWSQTKAEVGLMKKAGYRISLLHYLKVCFVPMLITVVLAMFTLLGFEMPK